MRVHPAPPTGLTPGRARVAWICSHGRHCTFPPMKIAFRLHARAVTVRRHFRIYMAADLKTERGGSAWAWVI